MMGKSHLALGSAVWLAGAAPAMKLAGVDLTPAEIGAGTVVCAGAAMLPDIDHPGAGVSRSLGPVTGAISRVFSLIFGGHRNGTHSLLFAVLAAAAAAYVMGSTPAPWGALAITFFFTSLVLRTLTEADGLVCASVSALIAAALITLAPAPEWLWGAVGLGCVAHMLGDYLTPQGVPALWPLSRARQSLPIIGRTGNATEAVIAFLCGAAAVYLAATTIFLPNWQERPEPARAATGERLGQLVDGGKRMVAGKQAGRARSAAHRKVRSLPRGKARRCGERALREYAKPGLPIPQLRLMRAIRACRG